MRIKLISQELFEELSSIQRGHPELTFQSEGYQYLSPEVRADKETQIGRVEEILKEHVAGFQKFHNFREGRIDVGVVLRFDYDWGAAESSESFVGAGYLPMTHLRDGFPKEEGSKV